MEMCRKFPSKALPLDITCLLHFHLFHFLSFLSQSEASLFSSEYDENGFEEVVDLPLL